MTTQELKQYIDKVLGNSIRCLLPSYWWKRLFGLVVDEVDKVDTKVKGVSTKVKDLSEQMSGIEVSVANIVVVEWDGMESSTTVNNKEAYTLIRRGLENNKPIAVVVSNTAIGLANPHYVVKSFNIRNENNGTVAVWIRFISESTEDHSQFLMFKLTEDGTLKLNKSENIYDDSMSAISTNPVQNKVVTAAINNKADKSDIKTLNGVSLLGGGNLQLGDGETIVYDDTDVKKDISDLQAKDTQHDAKLTELSDETSEIKKNLFGVETLTGEIKQTYVNTIASLQLTGNVKHSIKLTFASASEDTIYPRLYSLSGQSLTSGTMAAGLTEFVIEYTPSEDMEVELKVNIGGSNPNLVKTQVQIVVEAGVSILERLEKVEGSTTEIKEELVEDIAEIKNVLYGRESFVGAAMASGMNVLAKLKLKASINYSINLTFEALAEGYVFPRLFSLDGVQLTVGTMVPGKDAFLIEYTPSEDMEVELRVNIGPDNPNLVGTQCYVVVDTGKSIEERLAKVEDATGIPYVISKIITI